MIIVRAVVVSLCLVSIACARPASIFKTFGRRRGSFRSSPSKMKRQTDELRRQIVEIDHPYYGEYFSSEQHDEEPLHSIRGKASVAELFRHRLMACGLITTKSPDMWKNRLIAELEEIIAELERRCELCKPLYDEPCRYEILRRLMDPCPPCCRKDTKKRLLMTLQKLVERSLDSGNMSENEQSNAGFEDEYYKDNLNILPYTDTPMARKTTSVTEIPMHLTTPMITIVTQKNKFNNSWWPLPRRPNSQFLKTQLYDTSFINTTHDNDHGGSLVHAVNEEKVENVYDFLQHYINAVYKGQPGDEQRKQFFLDQLCQNATNGRIVLQCADSTGARNTRATEIDATEKLSARHASESSNSSSDIQIPLLFATPTINCK
ncbi:uncharacterized protein LOC128730705 [Anopheles nili]|uniref:uncharacterized protein LOC128730705 n=1 Tax=Anopheles nili TaxID=185578 RepID=UPI00237B9961|nr:uncharacterized protein LOC128730705 [Anopheles nili]